MSGTSKPSPEEVNFFIDHAHDGETLDLVAFLHEYGASYVDAQNLGGKTALIWAATMGFSGMAKMLLDVGADTEVRDNYGRTALIYASTNGHVNMVELLLDHGADINAKDNHGKTPLMFSAVWPQEPDTARALLERGARADEKDNNGETAAEWAGEFDRYQTLGLIRYWAGVQQKQKEALEEQERQNSKNAATATTEDRLQKLQQLRPAKPSLKKGP